MIDQDQKNVLAAVVARLIPSDDGPGAQEAGAVEFIGAALQNGFFAPFAPWMEQGLGLLQSLAREWGRNGFCDCGPEEQVEILQLVQSGSVGSGSFPAATFFEVLLQLTVEAFLGHPRHGGNRDHAGWRYLGLSPEDSPGRCQSEPLR